MAMALPARWSTNGVARKPEGLRALSEAISSPHATMPSIRFALRSWDLHSGRHSMQISFNKAMIWPASTKR